MLVSRVCIKLAISPRTQLQRSIFSLALATRAEMPRVRLVQRANFSSAAFVLRDEQQPSSAQTSVPVQQENIEQSNDTKKKEAMSHDLNLLVGEENAKNEQVAQLSKKLLEAYDLFANKQYLASRKLFDQTLSQLEVLLGKDNAAKLPLLALGFNNLAEVLKNILTYEDINRVSSAMVTDDADVDQDGYVYRYKLRDIPVLYQASHNAWSAATQAGDARAVELASVFQREIGTLYNNMGMYYMDHVNNMSEAMHWLERSEELRKDLCTRVDPHSFELRSHYAITLNNIGQCYTKLRDNRRAFSAFSQASKLFDANSSDADYWAANYSPVYIVILNNIGLGYYNNKQVTEAMQSLQRALDIMSRYQQATGKEPAEEMGITCNNIAQVYYYKNQFGDAELFFRQALANFKKNLNPLHKNIAGVALQLSILLKKRIALDKHAAQADPKYRQEADALFKESQEITEYHKKQLSGLREKFSGHSHKQQEAKNQAAAPQGESAAPKSGGSFFSRMMKGRK